MKTDEIINLDYRVKENQKTIQKVLKQIKPLSKYSDECEIPLSAIEKAIVVMCKKYCMRIESFIPDWSSNNEHVIWKATLINETNMKIIGNVFGICLYELFAKIAIRLYSEIKKGIKTRSEGGS